MVFRVVKPGEFRMGIPDPDYRGPLPYAAPPHLVRITRCFLIGDSEVTQSQFETVMGFNPSHFKRAALSKDTGR